MEASISGQPTRQSQFLPYQNYYDDQDQDEADDEDQDGDHGGDGNRGLGSRPHLDGMIIDHYHLITRFAEIGRVSTSEWENRIRGSHEQLPTK